VRPIRPGSGLKGSCSPSLESPEIPGAVNVPWSRTTNDDVTYKSNEEIEETYREARIDFSKPSIAYCRIGERSSHSWLAIHELLGHTNIKNYDGSWTEYRSLVRVPVSTRRLSFRVVGRGTERLTCLSVWPGG